MNKVQIAKTIANVIVGAGTYRLVNGIVENNMETETTTDKVLAQSTSLVIGAMASNVTRSYTDQKIDEIVAWWKTTTNPTT
jgi:hypothetical protein